MSKKPEDYKCPGCGDVKGQIIWINGLAVLSMAGGIWRNLSGQCEKCGAELYFQTNSVLLKHLVEAMLKSRECGV